MTKLLQDTLIGSEVQAYDADLQAIAGLTPSNGDVLYYNSGWNRLAKGTDDQVLTLASGLPSWADANKEIGLTVFDSDTDVATGNGTNGIPIGGKLNGKNLTNVIAVVHTAGTTGGTTDIQIRRRRSGVNADMLSNKITLSAGEYYAEDELVDTSNDDVQTGDMIYIDVESVNTTAPKGLSVILVFE